MKKTGRYEMKYLLEEDRAVAVADYVRAFLRPSEYNREGPVRGHPIMSLYLDSPDFFLFRQAYYGHRNRMKLRIRFYDEHWNHPAFLEIKRRVCNVIVKDRAIIGREDLRRYFAGGWPNPSHWPDPASLMHGERQLDVYFRFWQLCNALKAKPVTYISYLREVYETANDNEMRVTFDRQIAATPYDESTMRYEDLGKLTAPTRGIHPPPDRPPYFIPYDGVVLELKFSERTPSWIFDLVRIFNLKRRDLCKYAASVDGMMLQWGKPPLPHDYQALTLRGYD